MVKKEDPYNHKKKNQKDRNIKIEEHHMMESSCPTGRPMAATNECDWSSVGKPPAADEYDWSSVGYRPAEGPRSPSRRLYLPPGQDSCHTSLEPTQDSLRVVPWVRWRFLTLM